MSYENVKLWFAKDEDNNIVTIDEIKEKNNTYTCPVCGSPLNPKAIDSLIVTPHFAHVDASKCNNETMIHWWFKHKFIEKGDKLIVVTDVEKEYVCSEVLVEKRYEVTDGIYRPDVTVLTECGCTIYFEMAFSNKKKVKDYLDIWLELKNSVVEIDIKQFLNKEHSSTFKALFYDGKCFNVKKNDAYYNNIGKYKEEMSKEPSEKIKRRLRKLDWFWDELIQYKNKTKDIHSIIDIIKVIKRDDREIVKKILKKQDCSNVFEEYIKINSENIYKTIINYLEAHQKSGVFNIQLNDVIKWKKLYTKVIRFDYVFDSVPSFNSFEIDTLLHNEDSAMSLLKSKIKKVENDFIDHKRHKDARNNLILNKAIDDLRYKYKQFDSSYSVYLNSFYTDKTFVDLDFSGNNKDVYIEDDIVYTDDYHATYTFLTNEIEEIMTNNSSSLLERKYNDALRILERKYDRKTVRTDTKYVPSGYLGMKKKKHYLNLYFDFSTFKACNEDLIKISTSVQSSESSIETIRQNHYLYKNVLFPEQDILDLNDKDSWNRVIPIKVTAKQLNQHFSEVFVDLIYKISKYYTCVDCSAELELLKGEIKFYIDKKFELPKRCKTCRQKRKQPKERNNY